MAPRLNAAGRLQGMTMGMQALLTDDGDTARAIAERPDDINRRPGGQRPLGARIPGALVR